MLRYKSMSPTSIMSPTFAIAATLSVAATALHLGDRE